MVRPLIISALVSLLHQMLEVVFHKTNWGWKIQMLFCYTHVFLQVKNSAVGKVYLKWVKSHSIQEKKMIIKDIALKLMKWLCRQGYLTVTGRTHMVEREPSSTSCSLSSTYKHQYIHTPCPPPISKCKTLKCTVRPHNFHSV